MRSVSAPKGLRAQRVGLAQKLVGTGLYRSTDITLAGSRSTRKLTVGSLPMLCWCRAWRVAD